MLPLCVEVERQGTLLGIEALGPPALPAPGACRVEPGLGPLLDEVPLELGQCPEDGPNPTTTLVANSRGTSIGPSLGRVGKGAKGNRLPPPSRPNSPPVSMLGLGLIPRMKENVNAQLPGA
jgi:hypothetical protein